MGKEVKNERSKKVVREVVKPEDLGREVSKISMTRSWTMNSTPAQPRPGAAWPCLKSHKCDSELDLFV